MNERADPPETSAAWVAQLLERAAAWGFHPNDPLLHVDVPRQVMSYWQAGRLLEVFPVSTARAGLGARQDSYCTPTGFHRVCEWIGDGEPLGRVFVHRLPTDEIIDLAAAPPERDRITTRILRLEGLEQGVNRGPGIDSFERTIYIHGTAHEHLLGQPASLGCIHMANRAVVRLFNATRGRRVCCWIGSGTP